MSQSNKEILALVYNPNSYPCKIITYMKFPDRRHDYLHIVYPHRTEKLYCTKYLKEAVKVKCVICFGECPDCPYRFPIPFSMLGIYEDLVTITQEDMNRGFFTTTYPVIMEIADASEFVPVDGIQQIYGIDYTVQPWEEMNTSKVIFDSRVEGGPTNGIQDILEVGDKISFRYYYKKSL